LATLSVSAVPFPAFLVRLATTLESIMSLARFNGVLARPAWVDATTPFLALPLQEWQG
jgi:hypothetical protein